jgi:hypothetical protein
MRRGGVWNTAEGRREPQKFGETSKVVFWPCNPLKSHKTAQSFLWKSLEQNTLDLEKLGKMQADRHYFAISTMSAGEALHGRFPHL